MSDLQWASVAVGLAACVVIHAIERYRIRRAFRNYPRGWTRINHKEPRA